MSYLLKYALRLLALTAILLIVTLIGSKVVPFPLPSQTYLVFIIMFFVGLFGHLVGFPGRPTEDPKAVVVRTLFAVVTRFVVYVLLAVGIVYVEKENAVPNLVLFFFLYVPYTVFEIRANRSRQRHA